MALPAQGRSIEGEKAARLICRELVEVVERGLLASSLEQDKVRGLLLFLLSLCSLPGDGPH